MRTDITECPVCLGEYQAGENVVQLKCHKNHIFHRECLRKFIENLRDQMIGNGKCPICQ